MALTDIAAPEGEYAATRRRLGAYFDGTAAEAWTRLTSDAPVSRIRRTVREGRDAMRAALLARLPDDLTGVSVLDAGCGPGGLSMELARRGARVTAVDLSASLLDVARLRIPASLAERIKLHRGDMLDDWGTHDVTVAMDVLIHYRAVDIARTLARLGERSGGVLFTTAPLTPMLAVMHGVGRMMPTDDRAPRLQPVSASGLRRTFAAHDLPEPQPVARVHRGFYISQAWEMRP